MPIFEVTADVMDARGTQTYQIKAKNAKEAFDAVKKGGGKCVDECVEVMDIQWDENSVVEMPPEKKG